MGTYYLIYGEAHICEKWYNINPLIKKPGSSLRACPIIEGQSWLRDAYEKLGNDHYMHGRPANLSRDLREIFDEDDDEN